MNTDISYVWVSDQDDVSDIPSQEMTHGMKNVIRTAKMYPERTINLYIDAPATGAMLRCTSEHLPSNIKISSVAELFTECREIAKHDENPKKAIRIIDNCNIIYLKELSYGRPAFAANAVKLLAIYKGGHACDIGWGCLKENINNLEQKGGSGQILYVHLYADSSVLGKESALRSLNIWSGLYSSPAVLEGILCMLERPEYKEILYAKMPAEDKGDVIYGTALLTSKIKQMLQDKLPMEDIIMYASESIVNIHGTIFFEKPIKINRFDFQSNSFKDMIYGTAASVLQHRPRSANIRNTNLIPRNSKLSHIEKHQDPQTKPDHDQSIKKVERYAMTEQLRKLKEFSEQPLGPVKKYATPPASLTAENATETILFAPRPRTPPPKKTQQYQAY